MSESINCTEARAQFALLLYGELSFDEEERVESHVYACANCRAALEREKSLHAAFHGVAVEPPPSLLRECRAELFANLEHASTRRVGWWQQFTSSLIPPRIIRPVGALALVALGFFGAKVTPFTSAEAALARVRDVQADGNGGVRIVLDETRQRTISGRADDQKIRALLMEAVRDPSDPGLRAQSVDILTKRAQSADIRDALIYTLESDPNAGLRFKAIEALKAFAQEPEVRSALSQTLLSDANPGIRTQAIDLLTQGSGEKLDRQTIGTLQQVMLREDNAGVREGVQRVLASYHASPGMY